MNTTEIFRSLLVCCMTGVAILILIAILRSILGPRTADRVIAINMIGTMTIAEIAMLMIYLEEDYLADVCLIYAMISFLAVVVLCKVMTGISLEKEKVKGDEAAIYYNLKHQEKKPEDLPADADKKEKEAD